MFKIIEGRNRLFTVEVNSFDNKVIYNSNIKLDSIEKLVSIFLDASNASWDEYSFLLKKTQSECRTRFPGYKIYLLEPRYIDEILQFGGIAVDTETKIDISRIDPRLNLRVM